jgi:Domain of unknown function (DUF4145)
MDMAPRYVAPALRKDAFHCPSCTVFARQAWGEAKAFEKVRPHGGVRQWDVNDCMVSRCEHCGKMAIWLEDRVIWPNIGTGPLPNPDLPDDIRDDYLEALGIADRSSRGAAALLRLSVQKLCKHLGELGDNINNDIGNLVKKGLPARIQQALDVVRVVGNNAVHPGQMDLKDDREVAAVLFQLVNLIAQTMISEPKAVQEMYDKLPQTALDHIATRDRTKP